MNSIIKHGTEYVTNFVTDVPKIIDTSLSRSLNKDDIDKISDLLSNFTIGLLDIFRSEPIYYQYRDESKTTKYVQDLVKNILEIINLDPTLLYDCLDCVKIMILPIINNSPFLKEGVSKFCREDYRNSKPFFLDPENYVLVDQEEHYNFEYEYEHEDHSDCAYEDEEIHMEANLEYSDPHGAPDLRSANKGRSPELLRSYNTRLHSIFYKFDGKFLPAKYNSRIWASVPCHWIPVRLDDDTIFWYKELA